MRNTFLKLAFVGLLSVSSVFAAEGDLLSQATNGAVAIVTADSMALSQDEMSEVKGGATWYNSYSGIGSRYYNSNTQAISSPVTTSSSIYASSFRNSYWGKK